MRLEAFRLEDWDVVVYWLPWFMLLCGAVALWAIFVLGLMFQSARRLRWTLEALNQELRRVERALRDLPPRAEAFDEFVERTIEDSEDCRIEDEWHDLASNLFQGRS